MNGDPIGTAIATPLATPLANGMANRWPEHGSAYCQLPTASSRPPTPTVVSKEVPLDVVSSTSRAQADLERRIAAHERHVATRHSRYLAAPENVRQQFDRRLQDWVIAEADFDRWMADPDGEPPRRIPPRPEWDDRWDRRAQVARRPKRESADPYDRESLLALDLRELWLGMTGEDVPRHGRVTCPSPDHIDVHPDCMIYADGFKCFGCQAHGTIIDAAALILEVEPFGRDFFRVRDFIRGLA